MCGVFAILLNRPLREEDIALGRAGAEALRHRGPDGGGEWLDRAAGVYLGHRRLAIIDPGEASAQPMAQGGLVVSYNGELYNYRDLRRALAPEVPAWRTEGDVEVLLRAWRKWGPGALDRFDGMFAFALWDGARAHFAVDPFGEKPLFIAQTAEGVYVSSELAPLAALLRLAPNLEGAARAAYFALGNIPAPETAYREIIRLPPATIATVEKGQLTERRAYWTAPFGEPGRGAPRPLPESALDRVQEALRQSVERRLVADVPVGLFLSAGIDSSLVAAIAARDLDRKLDCMTVSFPRGGVADEAGPAAAIAAHLGLPHRVLESVESAGEAGPAALIDLFGQPSENVSSFPVLQLSALAARHFKVALTGMGGDEMTMGYGKHAALYRERWRHRLLGLLPPAVAGFLRSALDGNARAAGALDLYATPDWERYLALKNYPAVGWLRGLPGYQAWAQREFAGFSGPGYLWIPRYEQTRILANEHLVMYDLASMRHGLELRTPFLSRQLAETIAEFDPRALVAFSQKSLLRRLLGRYLPRALFDFPKSGFRYPQKRFLEACGAQQPSAPQLAGPEFATIWRRRGEGRGWERLALRLAAAAEFLGRAQAARV